jgi:hypothetical protein
MKPGCERRPVAQASVALRKERPRLRVEDEIDFI